MKIILSILLFSHLTLIVSYAQSEAVKNRFEFEISERGVAKLYVDDIEFNPYILSLLDKDKIVSIDVEKSTMGRIIKLRTLRSNFPKIDIYIKDDGKNETLRFRNFSNDAKSLFIIDGQLSSLDKAQSIPASQVTSINISKPETGIERKKVLEQYLSTSELQSVLNKKQDDEIVIINTRKSDFRSDSMNDNEDVGIKVRGTRAYNGKPVIIIDGVILEKNDINDIDPNDIDSLSIVKNKSTHLMKIYIEDILKNQSHNYPDLYKKASENGLIIITSKKK